MQCSPPVVVVVVVVGVAVVVVILVVVVVHQTAAPVVVVVPSASVHRCPSANLCKPLPRAPAAIAASQGNVKGSNGQQAQDGANAAHLWSS